MANITKFEDIQAWQEARKLTRQVYGLTSKGEWAKDFGLRDQIRRASVSVMSNIAEGFDRDGDAEFHRFLVIAKGSAAEVKSQLYVALDLGYVDRTTFSRSYELAEVVSRLLGGLMRYLKPKRPASPSSQPTQDS